MKHIIILLTVIIFASCEKTIIIERYVDNTNYMLPTDTIYGRYEVFNIEGEIKEGVGYLGYNKNHNYIINFDKSIMYFDDQLYEIEYSQQSDTLMIESMEYVPTMIWFSECLIVENGDTLVLEPLKYGTNLTIRLKRY